MVVTLSPLSRWLMMPADDQVLRGCDASMDAEQALRPLLGRGSLRIDDPDTIPSCCSCCAHCACCCGSEKASTSGADDRADAVDATDAAFDRSRFCGEPDIGRAPGQGEPP